MNDGGPWVAWAGSAGIGLALGLGVLYLILRGTAWSPGRGDPVRAARTHAMITALIAFFAAGTAGLSRLTTAEEDEVFGNGAFPVTTETEGETVRTIISSPVPGLTWFDGLSIVLGPVLGFALVYVVAQYTWPRQSGAVRTARLIDRRPADLLPRYLTAFTALIMAAALGLVALAWTTPALEARQVNEEWNGESGGGYEQFEAGSRAGADFAPWLLLAVVLTALAFVVVLRAIGRRAILGGLHPLDDDRVRRIAVNRALRTAAAMILGIGQAGFNAWAGALRELAVRAGDYSSDQSLDQWVGGTSIALLLVLLFWRSPHVSELGSHTTTGTATGTVTGTETHDAGRSPRGLDAPTARPLPAPPGTARAVLRLRLDGAALAWMVAVPIAVVVVFTQWWMPASGPWSPVLWFALPCAAALLILGFTEFGVRRGHCPAGDPSTSGKPSRWPVLALGLAILLAAVWCALCLIAPAFQTRQAAELATALAVTTAGFTVLCLALARIALRRPTLGRATSEQDAALRAGGADRILAVGAAGVFAATGAALLAGVQVWNGFITSAVFDPGINELPDALLMARALLLFVLFGLIVACVIAPAPEVPGVSVRPSRPGGEVRDARGALRP